MFRLGQNQNFSRQLLKRRSIKNFRMENTAIHIKNSVNIFNMDKTKPKRIC